MRRQLGFTMVELITVIVLIGVLAAIGIPRLMGGNVTSALVFADQVTSGLRLAQKAAVARRRTVCVGAAASAITIRIRTAVGEGVCGEDRIDGITDDLYQSKDAGIVIDGMPSTLRFQPDGAITGSDGQQIGRLEIRIKSDDVVHRTIRLEGSTGNVD